MVNYDIPWNPNRLEQRMGRIHRNKQEREAMIWNIVAQNTREGEVMECLLHKLEDMRLALGSDRVYDVIGEIIPAPRFDALMKDWLSRRRTMTEILADMELQTDVEHVARIKADMQDKALGSRYIEMSKLCADVQQSRENRLMPEYIERFFLEAWRSFGGTITPVKERKGVWYLRVAHSEPKRSSPVRWQPCATCGFWLSHCAKSRRQGCQGYLAGLTQDSRGGSAFPSSRRGCCMTDWHTSPGRTIDWTNGPVGSTLLGSCLP